MSFLLICKSLKDRKKKHSLCMFICNTQHIKQWSPQPLLADSFKSYVSISCREVSNWRLLLQTPFSHRLLSSFLSILKKYLHPATLWVSFPFRSTLTVRKQPHSVVQCLLSQITECCVFPGQFASSVSARYKYAQKL